MPNMSEKNAPSQASVDNPSSGAEYRYMDERIVELQKDVGTLKVDVGTLKVDVSILKTDVNTLKSDVSILKSDVNTLKTDVAVILSNYVTKADLAREIAALRAEMALMEVRLIKWFIATALTLTVTVSSTVFLIARLVH